MGCILLPGCSLPIPGLAYLELILGITENRDVLIKFLSWKKITQNTICFSTFLGEKGIESFFNFFFYWCNNIISGSASAWITAEPLVFSLAAAGSLVDVVGISWFKFKNHDLRTVLCFDAITCLVENTLWPLSVFEPRIVNRLIRESFEPRIDWLDSQLNRESFD